MGLLKNSVCHGHDLICCHSIMSLWPWSRSLKTPTTSHNQLPITQGKNIHLKGNARKYNKIPIMSIVNFYTFFKWQRLRISSKKIISFSHFFHSWCLCSCSKCRFIMPIGYSSTVVSICSFSLSTNIRGAPNRITNS